GARAAVGRDALCAGPFARAPAAQRQGNGAPERRPPGADRAGRRQPGVGVTDHAEQVERLLAESEQLQDGPAKVALIGQAAAVADSHNDVELAFCVRKGLLGACLGADQCELLLVTFTWCLAQHDRDPERFPAERLLWEFRWVVSSLAFFPEMTRTRIEEMQAEMARRYQAAGASPRSFCLMCRKMAVDMGDAVAATAADRAFRRSPADWLSDGYETERGFGISYRLFRNENGKAPDAAMPFLKRQVSSKHFEGQACADALLPLLRAGRAAEAMPCHRRGYKLRCDNARHLDSIAKHIAFLALTDNCPRAVRLFAKHLPAALQTTNAFTRMRFVMESLPLFDRLRKVGRDAVRMRVPPDCPLAANGETAPIRDVREWARGLAADLAHTFDARNGNDYYSRRLAPDPPRPRP